MAGRLSRRGGGDVGKTHCLILLLGIVAMWMVPIVGAPLMVMVAISTAIGWEEDLLDTARHDGPPADERPPQPA